MERGFVEPTDLPGVPHTPPSQGSRQSQHSGQGSERGTGRPGNVRNQTGQDNPFQAATGTQGSHVHAAQWQQQQQHPCPGLGPSVMPQGPAWFGAQWMPRGPNLSSGVPNLAAVPPFPGAGGCGCQFSCSGPRAPVGGGLCGPGMNVGGCVPQQSRVQDVLQAFSSLNEAQMQAVFQQLQEQFVTNQQRRLVPDVFGQRSDHLDSGTFDMGAIPGSMNVPSGLPPDVGRSSPGQVDVFAKSEKWLAPAPIPALNSWTSREQEIIGWSTYLEDLVAWAAQASLEFSVELQHASRWPRPISWAGMSGAQQARSRRLVAILRSAFSSHPRCANLIAVFCEGVSLNTSNMNESSMMIAMSQAANGYELLRQLTLEFSIRTRSEALSLRTSISGRSFTLSAQETSPGSVVTDTIRKIDYECARYARLLGTLPSTVDTTGLRIGEADLLLVLLRSLPEVVKNYCLHHSVGDSYESYRNAAKRWEEQQRLFGDFGQNVSTSSQKKVHGLHNEQVEMYNISDEWPVAAITDQGDRCGKCGSRKHNTQACQVDLSKTKCFRCNQFGHVGMNCRNKTNDTNGKGKGKSSGKTSGKQTVIRSDAWNKKGKGKSKNTKGYGKKGKLNELTETETEQDWTWTTWDQEDDWHESSWTDEWTSWDTSDWSEWTPDGQVDQIGSHTTYRSSGQQDEQPIGSLVLSPLLSDLNMDDGSFGRLELIENSSEPRVSSTVASFFPGLRGNSQEGTHLSGRDLSSFLVSPEPMRCVVHRVKSLVDERHTVSVQRQVDMFLPFVYPLLSQLAEETDSTWWLLDSGASTTVLAESSVNTFRTLVKHMNAPDLDGFRAANGSKVAMSGQGDLSVHLLMADSWGTQTWKQARMKVMVGQIRHNVLSVTALAHSGWFFSQGPHGFDLSLPSAGLHAVETGYFANCPWVRLHPSEFSHAVDAQHGNPDSGIVCPVTKAADADLEQHRRQGHVPFHPNCLECAKGRSVFQHRRQKDGERQAEVQADFAFISSKGEVSREETSEAVKVLVMTDLLSTARGYVVVGTNVDASRRQIVQWLDHFGLKSKGTRVSLVVHSDAEVAVGEMIAKGAEGYSLLVRRAAPQQHQAIGAAERAVRELKEGLSVLRSDLNLHGVDIVFSRDNLGDALLYCALCYNHFSKARGTDSSPLEMIAGRKLSKPTTSLFGSCVLAELPDSVRGQSPNETRNIEACFIHPGLVRGSVVQGFVRVDGAQELIRFTARNVRPIEPLQWKVSLGSGVFSALEQPTGELEAPNLERSDKAPEVSDLPPDELRRLKAQDHPAEPSPLAPRLTTASGSRPRKRNATLRIDPVPMEIPRPQVDSPPEREETYTDVNPEPVDASTSVREPFVPTRGCPSCDTKMVAPGIRHSASCKRRFAEWEAQVNAKERKIGTPLVQAEDSVEPMPTSEQPSHIVGSPEVPREREFQLRFKRKADDDTETLEQEIKRQALEALTNDNPLGFHWVETGEPVQLSSLLHIEGVPSFSPLTGPDMFDHDTWEMNSIRFDHGHVSEHVPMQLGGRTVLIWKPTAIIDDQTLDELNLEQGFVGMQEEIHNLEHCKTGQTISEPDMKAFCQKYPNARVISSRWVAAYKSPERVRTRIVAKDFNRGQSARSLGFSSPTPSIEALHLILAIAATRKYRLRGLDISHAFMHSPLGKHMRVILKLPLSVSLDDGQPAFLVLDKALNGLRDASLCWLQLLSETVKTVGLWTDSVEPCVYSGAVYDKETYLGHVLAIVYVDDILLASSTMEAENFVAETISKVVPTKTTGEVPVEGGSLTFIGRIIQRVANADEFLLSVNPTYLDSTFRDFGIDKGSESVPDVASHLEKTMSDESSKKPLSSEAYGRFRRALGKLLWMSQVRHDLKTWLSIIGCHQAAPMAGTEAALRAVLRFLKSDMHVALTFPSRDPSLESQVGEMQLRTMNLHCFSDASFAPYRFNKRRGISGGCVFFERSLVRSLARQQHALSLSSCEAELYALQSVCQESIAFGKLVHRVLFSLEEMDEADPVHVFLESDSSSALQLVKALDIPKKSRHVEIRLLWIREQLDSGRLHVLHRSGETNPADLFTKCLGSRLFFTHRYTIGLVKLSGLSEILEILQYAVQ